MTQLTLQQKLNMANKTVHDLMEQNAKLKDDLVNANSDIEKLIKTVNEVTAENYALKAEIEALHEKGHINLAENALHEKEQPIIYSNCTFYNK
jgi:predicted  nucleic acid-binding Zn-ribbon protein